MTTASTFAVHRSFEYTEALFDKTKNVLNRPNQSFWDLLKKVGMVAFAILGTLPLVLVDLVLLAARNIKQVFYPEKVLPSPPQKKDIVREGRAPTYEEMGKIFQTFRASPRISNQTLLERALEDAFSYLNPERKELYQQLIENDGVLEVANSIGEMTEIAPPLNIYQWCASAYLVYLLRILPIDPYLDSKIETMRELREQYQALDPYDKACALLTILVSINDPASEKWELTQKALDLVREIQKNALALTRDQEYLREIYYPVVNKAYR